MAGVPPLPRNMRLQNADGTVSADFARWWQQNIVATQAASTAAATAATAASAAQSQAQTAAAAATSAGAGFASGADVGRAFSCSSGTRVVVSEIALVGITAGTMRFDTTAFYSLVDTTMTGSLLAGQFWITEQLTSGGTKNDLYTDTWTALDEGGGIISVYIDDEAALNAARPVIGITGNVTYRLEVARVTGTQTVTNAYADFRAAQAS